MGGDVGSESMRHAQLQRWELIAAMRVDFRQDGGAKMRRRMGFKAELNPPKEDKMLARVLKGGAIAALAGAAMFAATATSASAFTLSASSPAQSIATSDVDSVYYHHHGYGHYHHYHHYHHHHHYHW
jgi:hypothetical protein